MRPACPVGDERLDVLRLDEEGFAALEDPPMSLPERVAIVVAGVQRTTPEALQVDSDGDIGIRSGSAMVFVRIRDNPPLVDVFSPVLTDIEASEKLYAKLSELTTKMPIGRLYHANKTVWASVPVFGRDFQATHLMLAVQVMTGSRRRTRRPAARRVRRQAVLRRRRHAGRIARGQHRHVSLVAAT